MDALVAIDPADGAEALIAQAVAFGARTSSTLHLRTVSPMMWTPEALFGGTENAALAQEWEHRRRHEQQAIERLLDQVPAPMRGTAKVLQGRPHEALLQEAESYDLVMIGTHGRKGLARMFLGSVAERVVRSCPRPLVVLRLDQPPVDLDRPLRVLVPVDADDPHIRGALAARSLLGDQCEIHLVYALADLRLYEASGLTGPAPTTPEAHPHRAWAEERIRDLLDGFSMSLQLHFVLRSGENPAEDLARFAQTVGADLLALPTHGRTGIDRIAYGSVAERLVRAAPCPVLVVR